MMLQASLLIAVVAMATGYPAPYFGFPYGGYYGYPYYNGGYGYGGAFPHYRQGYQVGPVHGKMVYNGEYPGTCDDKPDGLYYVNDHSFAYCFSGQKTVQPCAEGSANPPLNYFTYNNEYSSYDFCSVNLVANGYGPYGYAAPPVAAGKKSYNEYEKKPAH